MKTVKLSTVLAAVFSLNGTPSSRVTDELRKDAVLQIGEALRDAWLAVPWWQTALLERRCYAPEFAAGTVYAVGAVVASLDADGVATYYECLAVNTAALGPLLFISDQEDYWGYHYEDTFPPVPEGATVRDNDGGTGVIRISGPEGGGQYFFHVLKTASFAPALGPDPSMTWIVAPGEDAEIWEVTTDVDPELALDEVGKTEMESVTEVWDSNPDDVDNSVRLRFVLRGDQCIIKAPRVPTSVWVEFQRTVPVLDGTLWETGLAIAAEDVRYDLDGGDCWRALAAIAEGANTTRPGQAAAGLWELMEIPEHLATTIKLAASAELLRADGQEEKASARVRASEQALERALLRATEQQKQNPRGRNR